MILVVFEYVVSFANGLFKMFDDPSPRNCNILCSCVHVRCVSSDGVLFLFVIVSVHRLSVDLCHCSMLSGCSKMYTRFMLCVFDICICFLFFHIFVS